jgi:hypothetical protein
MYLGKLDFSKFSDDQVSSVTVNAIEKTPSIEIDAFEDVEYAIPLDVDEAITINLTPLELAENADFILLPSSDFRSNAFFALNVVANQQMSVTPSVKGVGFFAEPTPTFDNGVDYNFYKATKDTTVRMKIGINGFHNLGQYEINVYRSGNVLVKTIATLTNLVFGSEQPFSATADFTVSVPKDDRLFFYIKNNGGSDTNHGVQIQDGNFSLSYTTISPATQCKGLRASYVYNKLITLMNGQENAPVVTQSKLLTIELNQLVMTCSNSILVSQLDNIYQAGEPLQIGGKYLVIAADIGYYTPTGVSKIYTPGQTFKAIPGKPNFTTADGGFVRQILSAPQIIISWKDFFQAIYAIKGGQAGFGFDQGVACLEDLSYFYRQGLKALDIGKNISANSFKLTPNTDFSFNTIKVGYNDEQYDFLNGVQEVNSEQNYTTSLTSPKNELNLVCPVRADPYGIESIRIIPANVNANSAASKSDNDNFFIWIKPDKEDGEDYYQPLTVGEAASTYSGIDASYYNWFLSPKQNLLRGSNFLASVLDKMKGYQITLTSGLKNTDMVTIVSGRRVAESDPINISDLGAQIFIPYNIEFDTGLEFNALELLDVAPYGEVWLNYINVQYKAFITEVSVDVAQNSTQGFKLLLTPWNKTGNFIR